MELIAQTNLAIRNGRTLGDMFGEYTHVGYSGTSTVDYFIASRSIATEDTTLTVGKMTEFSDHKPLVFTIYTPMLRTQTTTSPVHDDAPTQYRWNDNSKDAFSLAQKSFHHQEQIKSLSNLTITNEEDVNNFNRNIINTLHNIADSSLQKTNTKKTIHNISKQKWFDQECRNS